MLTLSIVIWLFYFILRFQDIFATHTVTSGGKRTAFHPKMVRVAPRRCPHKSKGGIDEETLMNVKRRSNDFLSVCWNSPLWVGHWDPSVLELWPVVWLFVCVCMWAHNHAWLHTNRDQRWLYARLLPKKELSHRLASHCGYLSLFRVSHWLFLSPSLLFLLLLWPPNPILLLLLDNISIMT